MTNFEFRKDELEKRKGQKFCVLEQEEKMDECDIFKCRKCIFREPANLGGFYCEFNPKIIDWLLAEHTEKPKLTKRERAFCEFVESGYIGATENGYLYFFKDKPAKTGDGFWISKNDADVIIFPKNSGPFRFIRWEDDEPWSVEDLLKLEVQEDD